MTIALASDHAGVDLKDALVAWLKDEGHTVLDLGTNGHDRLKPSPHSRFADGSTSRLRRQ